MKKILSMWAMSLLIGGSIAFAAPPEGVVRLAKEDGTRLITPRQNRSLRAAVRAPQGDNLLFGSLLDTEATWSDYGLGVYSFPFDGTPISDITRVQAIDGLTTYAGVFADNRYYAITRLLAMETFYLDVYNTDTWELETYYSLGMSSIRYVPNDLAYDPVTELAYGAVFDYDGQNRFCLLYKYDLRKGTLEYVGTTRTSEGSVLSILAMSADIDGQLYGINNEGVLYKIDKTTARAERVGLTGVPKISSLQGSTITADGRFLCAAYDEVSYKSALYDVNTTTAKATKIADFPHNEQMTGIFVTAPFAKAGAPAAVSGLTMINEPGSLAGSLSFSAPTTTTSGAALGSSPLSATIRIYRDVENDGVIETVCEDVTKSVAPGATLTYDWEMQQTNYIISVTTSNTAGKSENSVIKFWAGHDFPAEIEDLKLERADNGDGVLTWTPPVKGYNGGYFLPSTLEYDIVRLPDNKVVAQGYKTEEGRFVDNTIDKVNTYRYRLTPRSSGGEGPSVLSRECGLGAYSTVPYEENFDSKTAFDLWTVVDLNQHPVAGPGDWSSTWGYGSQCMAYVYEPNNAADDWVISPPIFIKAGAVYQVSFKAWSDMSNYPESLKVMVGTSTDPADMSISICDYPAIKDNSDLSADKGGSFSVPEDGLYYIGFYCYSPANSARLYVDKVSVDMVSGIDAPGAVTGLKVEPGANGACSATVSFTAPSSTGSDAPLSSLDKIEIYRNGSAVAVATISPAEPGHAYSWTDNSPEDMEENTYQVIAFNGSGKGYPAEASAYIGIDIPAEVGDLYLRHGDDGEAIITWTAPTEGVHGGYINPAEITYGIVDNTGNPVASRLKATTFTDIETPANVQKMRFYTVKASSEAGTNTGSNTNAVIFGPSYKLPFAESFAGGSGTQTSPWTILGMTSVGFDWHVLMQSQTDTPEAFPQDGDSGFAQFTSYSIPKGDAATLTSPLISLEGEVNPELSFWFYHYRVENDYRDAIQPVITLDEGLTLIELSEPIVATASDAGWTRYSFPLNDYVGHGRVRLGLKGISDYGYNIFVDNITVKASEFPPVTDLTASLNGRKVTLIWNDPVYEGLDLHGYNVYRDGEKINTALVTDLMYEDELADDFLHTYTVTAMYSAGESGHSNSVSLTSGLSAAGYTTHVYAAGRSIVVECDGTAPVRVFTASGITLFAGEVSCGHLTVPVVTPGVYLVWVGDSVTKLTVK